MEITIFAKKRQSNDGRPFFTYLSTLTRKDGEEIKVQVKFRQDCGNPKGELCPMNIIVDKADANLSESRYESTTTNPDTGEIVIETRKSPVLWVSKWSKGSEYVDKSLDDFYD